jgi:hypothetical protein
LGAFGFQSDSDHRSDTAAERIAQEIEMAWTSGRQVDLSIFDREAEGETGQDDTDELECSAVEPSAYEQIENQTDWNETEHV